ncbi:3-deoxy-7-phosphoheptulonate synthase [Planctomycetota bacterium]
MIIVMKENAIDSQVQNVHDFIIESSMKPVLLHGTTRKVFAAIGENRAINIDHVNAMPGVDRIVRILSPYKLAGPLPERKKTQVAINGACLGDKKIGVIAGPCSVENETQIVEIAHQVKEAGAIALRGGAYKPRTSPYSFQGLQVKGLEYLAIAKEKTGLSIVTEVISPDTVGLVSQYADVLQIGARNMHNYSLLGAVGRINKPVLLKRGISSTLEEFLLAAEYILSEGNQNVILCERGIRTFETFSRFTLSLSSVPFLKQNSHLPVLVDPSHGTGKREFVLPMARAAVAAGADGLLIEVHTEPEESFVDASQTVSCEEFRGIMKEVGSVARAIGRDI